MRSWDVREGIYSVAWKYYCCNWEGHQHRQFYRQHHQLNLQLDRHHIIRPARVFLPRVGRILVAHTPHSSYPILYPPIHDDEGDIFFSFAFYCLFWLVAHTPHSSYCILYPPIHIISYNYLAFFLRLCDHCHVFISAVFGLIEWADFRGELATFF